MQVSVLEQRLDGVEVHLLTTCTYIEDCTAYAQSFRQYTQCVNQWRLLRPYWDYLAEQRVVSERPHEGGEHLERIERDLHHQLALHELAHATTEKMALLASLKKVGGVDLVSLQAQNAECSERIGEQTARLQCATREKGQAQARRQRALDIAALAARIRVGISKKRALNKEEVEAIRRTDFNALVRQLQSALAAREHTLGNLALQKKLVDALAQQIADLEHDEVALGLLVKQLSPTEGLIAEGLLGFIKNFVVQMNALIKRVWSYPLVVKTCEMLDDASVDLDYKFPMVVMTPDNVVPDVGKGSTGMREIVNMAFMVTAMRYLHLQHSAVFLDEFGHSFDVEHRSAAMYMVKQFLEQHSFSQVFMISHDLVQYGALTNAEVCVLNDLNITVPKMSREANAHVVRR